MVISADNIAVMHTERQQKSCIRRKGKNASVSEGSRSWKMLKGMQQPKLMLSMRPAVAQRCESNPLLLDGCPSRAISERVMPSDDTRIHLTESMWQQHFDGPAAYWEEHLPACLLPLTAYKWWITTACLATDTERRTAVDAVQAERLERRSFLQTRQLRSFWAQPVNVLWHWQLSKCSSQRRAKKWNASKDGECQR